MAGTAHHKGSAGHGGEMRLGVERNPGQSNGRDRM